MGDVWKDRDGLFWTLGLGLTVKKKSCFFFVYQKSPQKQEQQQTNKQKQNKGSRIRFNNASLMIVSCKQTKIKRITDPNLFKTFAESVLTSSDSPPVACL